MKTAIWLNHAEVRALLRQDRIRKGERDNGYSPEEAAALDSAVAELRNADTYLTENE